MNTLHRVLMLAGVALLAGCSDRLAPPTGPVAPDVVADVGVPAQRGAVLGVVESLDDRTLLLRQSGFDFSPAKDVRIEDVRHAYAVGTPGDLLPVRVTDDTRIFLDGEEKKFADLKVGTQVIIAGQVSDGTLLADRIGDLTSAGPPAERVREMMRTRALEVTSNPRAGGGMAAAALLCEGQDLDYSDANILEFQGCWGGPSAADDINTNVLFFCPLAGCFVIDRLTYVAALSGGKFAFPFRFHATPETGLVYHVPSDLALSVEPLPATTGTFSFVGGTGVNLGLNVDFCWITGDCDDLGTMDLSVLSQIFESRNAGPLEGVLEVKEPACPSIGFFTILRIPLDPMSVGLCQDNDLVGRPFKAYVSAPGHNTVPVRSEHSFTSVGSTMRVRPQGMHVGVLFDDLSWDPELRIGMYFRFEIFGINVWDTPHIPFGNLPFPAVREAFPGDDSWLSLAGDPDSGDPLYQPEFVTVGLDVAKAPTQLLFWSGSMLTEGSALTVLLRESYDGAPIAGRTIAFVATGLHGTPSVSLDATTSGSGLARVVLPVGEYDVTASFAGSMTYLPSTASLSPVYVYRPTTFVIWGGNADGIVTGTRHQFWGQGWVRQVESGPFGGNASFQGFAIPLGPGTWASPPASSGHGPASVPDLIGVIVTTEVHGRGAGSTGNIAGYALLRVDDPATYQPNGGHGAWGVVRAPIP